jgi:hypothetical protein
MFMRNLRILLLACAALAWAGLAAAQAEPTIQQIYATAQSGQVDKARQMTQEVLRTHPNSAKAHFVLAELEASQGNVTRAGDELATAERLAPGLPFARPEAVQALRARISPAPALRSQRDAGRQAVSSAPEAPRSPSFPWGILLLAGGFIAAAAWFMRSRTASRNAAAAAVPARFGAAAAGTGWGAQQPGYGAQPAYAPAPAQSGMGGNIMGGLATGLAVGAGVLAAQEIGRRMLGDHQQHGIGGVGDAHATGTASDSQLARDAGLGSVGGGGGGNDALPADFGINDTASWDDGGSMGADDGGGWDS